MIAIVGAQVVSSATKSVASAPPSNRRGELDKIGNFCGVADCRERSVFIRAGFKKLKLQSAYLIGLVFMGEMTAMSDLLGKQIVCHLGPYSHHIEHLFKRLKIGTQN